jgi:hypothetical protein
MGFPMTDSIHYVRCEELLEADVNGEIVALHVERGQCYGLNEVASEIWRMLAGPTSVDDICRKLCAEYEVDSSTCQAEVEDLVKNLREEGLVKELG